jgi:m7GpppX diphosphatase
MKRKAPTEDEGKTKDEGKTPLSLAGFQITRVLRDDTWGRQHVLLGSFPVPDSEERSKAIVILKQKHFSPQAVTAVLSALSVNETLKMTMENNEYTYYEAHSPGGTGMLGVEVINPCTWWHVAKYTKKQVVLIEETPADFTQITAPYVDALPPKKLQWLFDILDGKKEAERVLVADPDAQSGFVLVMHPTMQPEDDHHSAFYLGICHARGIRSLRDLNASHLPLLENMRDKGYAAIEQRHGLARVDLKVFFHYQPSFFHLHVHFRALGRAANPADVGGREYLLEEVIDNITIASSYYMQRTIGFSSAAHPKLAAAFHSATKAKMATDEGCGEGVKLIILDASVLAAPSADEGGATAGTELEKRPALRRPELDSFLEFVFAHFEVACVLPAWAESEGIVGKERAAKLLFVEPSGAEGANELQGLRDAIDATGSFSAENTLCLFSPELVERMGTDEAAAPLCVISPPQCLYECKGDDCLSSGGDLRHFLWSMRHVTTRGPDAAGTLAGFVALRNPFAVAAKEEVKDGDAKR